MNELFRLFGTIGVNNSDANKSIDETGSKAEGLGTKFKNGIKTAGKWALGIGAAATAVGAAVGTAMVKYGNMADELLDLSAITGMSTDEMQRWRQVAVDAGVDTNAVTGAMQTLNKQLERGNEISPRLAKGFESMGISAEEFKNLGADEQMRRMVETMLEMEGADRRAFANQMNMADILPMVSQLESEGKDLDTIMKEIDVPFSEDDLNTMNEFRQTWDNFKQKIFEVIGQALLPLFEWFNSNLPLIKEIFQTTFDVIGNVFGMLYGWVETAIGWFTMFFESNQSTFTGIWETIQEVFTQIIEFLQTAWETIKTFWQENGQAILDNAITIFDSIWNTVKKAFEAVQQIIQKVLDLVVPFIQTQLEKIKKFWDENGKQIMDAVKNAFEFIQSIIDFIMPAILFVIEMVWNNIKGVINGALDIIMGLIKTFSGLFTGDWDKMWEGIKQMLSGAIEFVWNLIQLTFMGRIVKGFTTFIKSVGSIFKNLSKNVKNIWNGIMDAVTKVAKMLWNGVKKVFTSLKNGVSNIFNGVKTFISGVWNGIKTTVTNVATGIWNAVKGAFNKVKDSVSNIFNSVKDTVTSIWDGIKDAISKPIDKAREAVKTAIDKIKGLFNFNFKWPKLKMPKFSIEGSMNPLKWLSDGVPKLKVAWNAAGGIFNRPTIFNTANAGLQGVGEAGPEAILPLNRDTLAGIGKGVAANMKDNQSESRGDIILHQTINSPDPISPAETARLTKRGLVEAGMAWR